jgi:hypothetical protein
MVRTHPGSSETDWSVGVSAAHRLGKAEDRVQFPDGPLAAGQHGLLVQREDAWLATRKSGFNSPAVHLRGLRLEA